MNIETNIRDTLSHDLPPFLWLCSGYVSFQINPRLKGADHFFAVTHYGSLFTDHWRSPVAASGCRLAKLKSPLL
jgi:cation diffusion facilitator CzcD-associated flavoprotein CzcO